MPTNALTMSPKKKEKIVCSPLLRSARAMGASERCDNHYTVGAVKRRWFWNESASCGSIALPSLGPHIFARLLKAQSIPMTAPTPATPTLSWPPPALEPVHGRLWPAIAVLAFADIVLVPPLLLSLGAGEPVGSLGPYGDAFWVPLATSFLGVLILIAGLRRLAWLLRGARGAARAGHTWRTILSSAADGSHDGGFLLTGARTYASLGPTERDTILAARTISACLSLGAVLLMPTALGLSILWGRLVIAGEPLLWVSTLWAPLVLWVGGLLAGGGARALAASARRKSARTAAQDASLQSAVSEWNGTLTALRSDRAERSRKPARPLVFGMGVWGTLLLALLAVLPVAAVVVTGTIGSILASMASPKFGNTRARFAAAETVRRFELAPDPSISPQAGGEALHALNGVGRIDAERIAPEKKPARLYPEPWYPLQPGAAAVLGAAWVDSLFSHPKYTAAQLAYLRHMAAHPAHAEFATVARARNLDIVGTRFDLPFGPGVTIINLPIPRFAGVRDGARAHLALAALELADGQPARAELAIREVISAGFRLLDDGPTLLDNLIGVALVDMGGDALARFFRATGRGRDAESLDWARSASRRAADRMVAGEAGWSAEAGLRAMPAVVLDSAQARGLRWEFLSWTAVFAPCANIRSVAFGPGEDYSRWLEAARNGLVRRPSDEALLTLTLKGPFGSGRCLPLWGGLRTIGQMR
jgi:hypothetical protein